MNREKTQQRPSYPLNPLAASFTPAGNGENTALSQYTSPHSMQPRTKYIQSIFTKQMPPQYAPSSSSSVPPLDYPAPSISFTPTTPTRTGNYSNTATGPLQQFNNSLLSPYSQPREKHTARRNTSTDPSRRRPQRRTFQAHSESITQQRHNQRPYYVPYPLEEPTSFTPPEGLFHFSDETRPPLQDETMGFSINLPMPSGSGSGHVTGVGINANTNASAGASASAATIVAHPSSNPSTTGQFGASDGGQNAFFFSPHAEFGCASPMEPAALVASISNLQGRLAMLQQQASELHRYAVEVARTFPSELQGQSLPAHTSARRGNVDGWKRGRGRERRTF